MITCAISVSRTFLFVMPIFAGGFWLFAEKGCVITPEAVPVLASTAAEVEPSQRAMGSMASAQRALFETSPSVDHAQGDPGK